MGWQKFTSDADKIVPVIGDKALTSPLLGRKELDSSLLGLADKTANLIGDTIVSFTSKSDKIVSLSGSSAVSLTGTKYLTSLLGELSTRLSFLGESPYSWFSIHSDTTYVTIDFTDRTCDIDDPNGDIILSGLVLYLAANNINSYPRSGTVWYDLSNSNNSCNLSGATFKLLGKSYMNFNGISDYAISTNIIDFERNEPFTLCGWVYNTVATNQRIIDNENASQRGYGLYISSTSLPAFTFNSTSTNRILAYGSNPLTANNWKYICATYSGSSSSSGVTIYVNGIEQPKTVTTDNLNATTISSNYTRIGMRIPTTQGFFSGNISIIQIYNKELNQSEITHNFEKDRWRFGI